MMGWEAVQKFAALLVPIMSALVGWQVVQNARLHDQLEDLRDLVHQMEVRQARTEASRFTATDGKEIWRAVQQNSQDILQLRWMLDSKEESAS